MGDVLTFKMTPDMRRRAYRELTSEDVFNDAKKALASGDSEALSVAKEELRGRATFMKSVDSVLTGGLEKAILTKPSEKRERPVKQAKPESKAKTGVNAKGKTYQYPKKPGSGGPQPASVPPPEVSALNPETLANLLHTTVGALKKIAEAKTPEQLITYFKVKGGPFIKKYKVPDSYWRELHTELTRGQVEKGFTIDPSAYSRDHEMHAYSSDLVRSNVTSLGELATFLSTKYAISKSEAKQAANELHAALVADGAIKERP